jgi:hypothetical protein
MNVEHLLLSVLLSVFDSLVVSSLVLILIFAYEELEEVRCSVLRPIFALEGCYWIYGFAWVEANMRSIQ